MSEPIPDYATVYSEWLGARLSTSIRNGVTELTTPLLDPFNDGVRVYIERTPTGFYIHDDGLTLEALSLHGVDVRSSERRAALAETALRSNGVALRDDRIETTASSANLPQRVHFLLSAMQRISDLWLTVRPSGGSDFFERVCDFLDSHGVLYTTNVSVPGKTVEHPVDIVIPLPKRHERFVKLIGTPSANTAKVVSFSWIEIAEVRPAAERVILLNDDGQNDGEVRRVSEQTAAILSGYSTAVYRWSQRDSEGFGSLYRAA